MTETRFNIDAYLQEISRYELLSEEEEQEILKAVQAKGVGSVEMTRIEEACARFVVSVANQYKNRGASLERLIAAGTEGVRRAALDYDTAGHSKFLKLAVEYMRQEMQKVAY